MVEEVREISLDAENADQQPERGEERGEAVGQESSSDGAVLVRSLQELQVDSGHGSCSNAKQDRVGDEDEAAVKVGEGGELRKGDAEMGVGMSGVVELGLLSSCQRKALAICDGSCSMFEDIVKGEGGDVVMAAVTCPVEQSEGLPILDIQPLAVMGEKERASVGSPNLVVERVKEFCHVLGFSYEGFEDKLMDLFTTIEVE